MKTTLVRAFVFSLVLTGFAASAVTRTSSNATNLIAEKGGPGSTPVPTCGWNDPTGCGIP